MMRRHFLIALAVAFAAFLPAGPVPGHAVEFPRDRLTIETRAGARYEFDIELAKTFEQMKRGLMFREEIGLSEGMLFVHPDQDIRQMWMKNTLIPLDMVFIASNGAVVAIHENATPLSTDVISSGVPARAVLELKAGTIRTLGIAPGDKVIYRDFGTR